MPTQILSPEHLSQSEWSELEHLPPDEPEIRRAKRSAIRRKMAEAELAECRLRRLAAEADAVNRERQVASQRVELRETRPAGHEVVLGVDLDPGRAAGIGDQRADMRVAQPDSGFRRDRAWPCRKRGRVAGHGRHRMKADPPYDFGGFGFLPANGLVWPPICLQASSLATVFHSPPS